MVHAAGVLGLAVEANKVSGDFTAPKDMTVALSGYPDLVCLSGNCKAKHSRTI